MAIATSTLGDLSLSSRVQRLREEALSYQPEVCVERAHLVTQVYRETEEQPICLRRALALKKVLEEMSIYILKGELVVGNQASKPRAAPIFPEYAVDWILEELEEIDKRPGDRFLISEQAKKELREILPYWKGKTVWERALAIMPDEVRTAFFDLGVIKATGNLTAGDGHIIVDFEKVLSKGLKGIIEEARKALDQLDLTDSEDLRKRPFLLAIPIVLDAVVHFAHRYAKLARDLAEVEADQQRREELLKIAEICEWVPENPPRTFYEAVQSVWLVQLVLHIESNGHSISLGRFDQYMYPFYKQDVEQGLLTAEQALELLECLWIKMFSLNKIRPWSHSRYSAGSPLYQNMTVGGQTPEGRDATNELSWLCLRAVASTRLTQPNFSVRYHDGTPDDFLHACVEVIRMGFGMPALKNDQVIIPALLKLGVARADAYNYGIVGCIEVAVPGKWGYRPTGMSFLNLMRILMIALNDGEDPQTGIRLCPGNGRLTTFRSFEQVMEAWEIQCRYFTRLHVILDAVADLTLEEMAPDVFCSALVQDCIQRGKTIKQGGAVYDFISGLQVGIANLGNALAAIKKLVFQDKLLSAEELDWALRHNFEGLRGEEIRQMLLNKAPKFGNDDDFVDQLTRDAYMVYIDEIARYRNTRYGRGPIGGTYYAGTSSISANVPTGANVGATPDGRKAGRPVAEGCSPSSGTDRLGPTAVLRSVAKLPTERIAGGVLLNQKYHPTVLETEAGMGKLAALIRAFFSDLKGWHIQFNVVSADTLRDAQTHPEKYPDLIVRVAGYSALFTLLDRETQDDIIARTEYVL